MEKLPNRKIRVGKATKGRKLRVGGGGGGQVCGSQDGEQPWDGCETNSGMF